METVETPLAATGDHKNRIYTFNAVAACVIINRELSKPLIPVLAILPIYLIRYFNGFFSEEEIYIVPYFIQGHKVRSCTRREVQQSGKKTKHCLFGIIVSLTSIEPQFLIGSCCGLDASIKGSVGHCYAKFGE